MPSRMDRYYETKSSSATQRTERNQELYDSLYSSINYEDYNQNSNVNEINEEKLRELLREEKKIPKRVVKQESLNIIEDDTRTYDINDIIEKAKDDEPDDSFNNYHKLKPEQIELMKRIMTYKGKSQEQDEKIDELLNTIASPKFFEQLNDKDLSLELFDDLKSDDEDTAVAGIETINQILNDTEEYKKENKDDNFEEKEEIDNSFYTSKMRFKADDFDDIKELKQHIKTSNKLMMITTVILLLAMSLYIALIFK